MIVLETDTDRGLERTAIDRIIASVPPGVHAIPLPPMSAIDYMLARDTITAGIEIKTRKETVEQVRGYGGLMLKHRKLVEMQQIATLLRAPCYVAFCFENARGPILILDVSTVTDPTPHTPPPRRNFRGLACDEEPVVYLDWDLDLRRIA